MTAMLRRNARPAWSSCWSALLMLLVCGSAHAQRPQSAVVPESIRVGDVFHAAVRLDVPESATLVAPDSLVLPADIENAGRREIRFDTAAGARRATVIYPLAAWRPGSYDLPAVTLRLVQDGGENALHVALPSFAVTSVLPADTAGIEARPARDVLGPNRVWWPILLALLLAALAALAFWLWWRRRRGDTPVVFTPAVPPRQLALQQLEQLRRAGLLERGELKPFFEQLTAILRRYAAALDPQWGVDLTTTELAARMRAAPDVASTLELVRILGAADLVKFARAVTTRDRAAAELDAARTWVERSGTETPADDATDRRVA